MDAQVLGSNRNRHIDFDWSWDLMNVLIYVCKNSRDTFTFKLLRIDQSRRFDDDCLIF